MFKDECLKKLPSLNMISGWKLFKAFKMFSGLNNLVVWLVKYLIVLTTQNGVRNRCLVRLIPHIGA